MDWIIGIITGLISSFIITIVFLIIDHIKKHNVVSYTKREIFYPLMLSVFNIVQTEKFNLNNGIYEIVDLINNKITMIKDRKDIGFDWFANYYFAEASNKFFQLYADNQISKNNYMSIKYLNILYNNYCKSLNNEDYCEFLTELLCLIKTDRNANKIKYEINKGNSSVVIDDSLSKKMKKIISVLLL